MGFFRALTAAAASTLFVLSTGCSGADGGDDEAFDIDNPLYSTMTGPDGSGGQNHLHPDTLDPLKVALYLTTTQSLATFSVGDGKWRFANNTPNNAIFDQVGGMEVMTYAMRCALPQGQTLWRMFGGFDLSYPGQGILTTTTGWKTAALSTSAAEDLMACMSAHLNPYHQYVSINLSGPNVTNDPAFDPTAYTWEEALWTSTITANPLGGYHIVISVWPLPGLEACPVDSVEGLKSRACPTGEVNCNLNVRQDRKTVCFESSNGWKCDGKPAIRTRLRVEDVPRMYEGCDP